MQVDQVDGPGDALRGPDHDAVGGECRVERRKRACHGLLAARLQHSVDILQPVNVVRRRLIGAVRLPGPRTQDRPTLRDQRHRPEHDSQSIDLSKCRRFLEVGHGRRGRLRRVQVIRSRESPVFVATPRKPHLEERVRACARAKRAHAACPAGISRRAILASASSFPRAGRPIRQPPGGCRHTRSFRLQARGRDLRSSRSCHPP